MQRFVWSSDIHLDRLEENERQEFREYVLGLEPAGFILAGDIAEADSVIGFLKDFRQTLSCPIYFVLGNHDFWGSSFDQVRSEVRSFVKEHSDFFWLSESGVVVLNESTALIGHEAWADASYAPVPAVGTVPRDFTKIDDLKTLPRQLYEKTLNQLGEDSAVYIRKVLREALVAGYQHIILVTHVPPFKEASLDRARRICGGEKLPFYSCKAIGDVLLQMMEENPDRRLTVLSGHTHEKCEVDILPNLQVKVLDGGYGTWYQPGILKI